MKYFNLIYLLFFCFFLLSCSKQDSSAIQLEIQDDIEIANLEIQEISQEFDCEEYMV